jgi:hypothetical protein
MKYYHVTHKENVDAIIENGLEGGWGDDGFGVYLFDDLSAAEDYAADGGWEGNLTEETTIILEIEDDGEDIYPIEVQTEWPNPEDYECVVVRPMEDLEGSTWKPAYVGLIGSSMPSP